MNLLIFVINNIEITVKKYKIYVAFFHKNRIYRKEVQKETFFVMKLFHIQLAIIKSFYHIKNVFYKNLYHNLTFKPKYCIQIQKIQKTNLSNTLIFSLN